MISIGCGDRQKLIEDKVRKLKIDQKVIFEGTVNNTNDYYQAMDCFILPSIYEGLPLVGVEAQISGLQCFFSDSITKELKLSSKANFVSLKQNPKEWANIILGKRNEKRNTEYFENYDLKKESERIVQRYIEMFER